VSDDPAIVIDSPDSVNWPAKTVLGLSMGIPVFRSSASLLAYAEDEG